MGQWRLRLEGMLECGTPDLVEYRWMDGIGQRVVRMSALGVVLLLV